MRLTEIRVFPVKSCGGGSLAAAELTPRGLAGDRRWMLVDAGGRFVTQRELPALALLTAEPTQAGLRLAWHGEAVDVLRPDAGTPRSPVVVWRDALMLPEATEAREHLARWLARPLRLVYQPDDSPREVSDWAEPGHEASLADEFPLLVTTTASLDDLGRAAGIAFGMERFRPNLVIGGAAPWAEDSWIRIRVGAVELDLVKPCARCAVTTVDPARGAFSGDEPLATLRRVRLSGDRRVPGVLFGWNAVPRRLGKLGVGDPVEVLATRAPWPIQPQRLSA